MFNYNFIFIPSTRFEEKMTSMDGFPVFVVQLLNKCADFYAMKL